MGSRRSPQTLLPRSSCCCSSASPPISRRRARRSSSAAAFVAPSASVPVRRRRPSSAFRRRAQDGGADHRTQPVRLGDGPLNAKPVEIITPRAGRAGGERSADGAGVRRRAGVHRHGVHRSAVVGRGAAGLGEAHPRMRRVGDDVARQEGRVHRLQPRRGEPRGVARERQHELCQAVAVPARSAPARRRRLPPAAAACRSAAPRDASARQGRPRCRPTSPPRSRRSATPSSSIDRSVVDKILENQAELMRSARIVPEQKDGKVVGVRLFGIQSRHAARHARPAER